MAISSILQDPNAESPLNCDAGNMIRGNDMEAFSSIARMYTKELALSKEEFERRISKSVDFKE